MRKFVVLEGIDGSGTTTQAKLLHEHWRKDATYFLSEEECRRWNDPVRTFEPTNGPVGRMIRDILTKKETDLGAQDFPHLFRADRGWHVRMRIRPALQSGASVVSDRYYMSSMVYQEDFMSMREILALNGDSDIMIPDVTVFIDVEIDVAMARIGAADRPDDIFEKREFLEKCIERYHRAVEMLRRRGENVIVIDGNESVDEVHQNVLSAIG